VLIISFFGGTDGAGAMSVKFGFPFGISQKYLQQL
jgi:hypothetical protein